jgi:hypothetical protein
MNKSKLTTIAACLIGFCAHTSQAAYTLFDNFNSYPSGASLIGQGPAGNLWTQTIGSPTGMVTQASTDGLAAFVGPTGPSAAYRALGPGGLVIPNTSSAATVFWQFTLNSGITAYNWNFVVTDVNPTDTAGTSEVQFNLDSTAGNFRARNAGAFKNLSIDGTAAGNVQLVANTTYNVWFEINNSVDNYRVFMQNDSVPGLAARTQVFANDGTTPTGLFGFRNGAAANDLINVNFGSGNGQTTQTVFDNIFVDTTGFNSINPVPEPSTWVLGLFGAALLAYRRRK